MHGRPHRDAITRHPLSLTQAPLTTTLPRSPHRCTPAERAAELLSTLDRGRPATSTMEKRLGHPARQLIIPARGIAKRMAAMKTTRMLESEGDASKKKKKKGGGKKKGKKK